MKTTYLCFIILLVFHVMGATCKYPGYKCEKDTATKNDSFCEFHKCHSYKCNKQVHTKRSIFLGKFRNLKSFTWVTSESSYIHGVKVYKETIDEKNVIVDEAQFCSKHLCELSGCGLEKMAGKKYCKLHFFSNLSPEKKKTVDIDTLKSESEQKISKEIKQLTLKANIEKNESKKSELEGKIQELTDLEETYRTEERSYISKLHEKLKDLDN